MLPQGPHERWQDRMVGIWHSGSDHGCMAGRRNAGGKAKRETAHPPSQTKKQPSQNTLERNVTRKSGGEANATAAHATRSTAMDL